MRALANPGSWGPPGQLASRRDRHLAGCSCLPMVSEGGQKGAEKLKYVAWVEPGSSLTLTYCTFIAGLPRAIIIPILQMEVMRLERLSNWLKANPGSLGCSVHCNKSLQAFNQPVLAEHILCAEYCIVCYAFESSLPVYRPTPREGSTQDGSRYPCFTDRKLEARRRKEICSKQHS